MAYCGRGRSAKHKMSYLANAYEFMGLGQGKKERSKTAVLSRVRFAPERAKRIFHLSTSCRAVYCHTALESGGVAHCGRLR